MPNDPKTPDAADDAATPSAADPVEQEVVASSAEPATDSASGQETDVKSPGQTSGVDPDDVKVPEFAALREGLGGKANGSMDRFFDVHVPVWAELGRVEIPLGELVKLAEGAVLRLDRPVSEPVDLVSQGVKLARGEVIVVDDCFAIRIKEIVAKK